MNQVQLQMHQPYPEPAASLLSLGDPFCEKEPIYFKEWPNYVEKFGFSLKDAPSLIQMLKDVQIQEADLEDPIVWADVHAWRTLGQLRSVEAIPHLLDLLDYEDLYTIDDLRMEELPHVFGKIGSDAIGPLADYINDHSRKIWDVIAVGEALEIIGKSYPETQDLCIAALSDCLKNYRNHDDMLNAFLIGNLVELQAVEQLDLIRKAFNDDAVDIGVMGDLEEVEIELGVRQERSTLKPEFNLLEKYFGEDSFNEEYSCGDPFCEEHHSHDDTPYVRMMPKIGRNDPCQCGSGKKYKKCCLD